MRTFDLGHNKNFGMNDISERLPIESQSKIKCPMQPELVRMMRDTLVVSNAKRFRSA